ncbi:hypothetical protein ACF09C_06440 [Streptomyces sp. NPDC014870]|uniref:hypothetical protein n=1 Tax=Streptomyces sp. NPDC014870 TaxID=3364925 RepID=UPI0036FC6566
MSPGTTAHPAPAAPAGAARRAVLVLALVLAALFGVGAGAGGPACAEARHLSTSQPADPGTETHELAEAAAAAPGRLRSRRRGVRPRDGRRAPGGELSAARASVPVPAPRPHGAGLRCVVMRC